MRRSAVVDGERFFISSARSHRRDERKAMIDRRAGLPVTRQCDLLDLNRSGIYYKPILPEHAGDGTDAQDRRDPSAVSILW